LVCSPEGSANLLNRHFVSKQCGLGIHLPSTCHPEGKLSSFAFISGKVRRLLSGPDAYSNTDSAGLFPLFYKKAAVVLAPKLSVIFRRLIRSVEFKECWKTANVVPVSKNVSSPIIDNDHPISITLIISKVLKHLIAIRFSSYLENEHLLPSC
jgi:hypothetical protein